MKIESAAWDGCSKQIVTVDDDKIVFKARTLHDTILIETTLDNLSKYTLELRRGFYEGWTLFLYCIGIGYLFVVLNTLLGGIQLLKFSVTVMGILGFSFAFFAHLRYKKYILFHFKDGSNGFLLNIKKHEQIISYLRENLK